VVRDNNIDQIKKMGKKWPKNLSERFRRSGSSVKRDGKRVIR
jgi:hypothetical protein